MIKKIKKTAQQGFTLIELIIVIAIIAILAAATFVAVDPATRLANSRNAKRWQAANAILDAVKLYQTDNSGTLPSGIDTTLRMLGTDSSGCNVSCGSGGSGSGTTSITDDSQTEFDAGNYSDTQWDSGNSWIELDATGLTNGSGTYTSSVKDAGSSVTWTPFSWTPSQPFYKELPDSAQSESAYSSGNANMTGNVLLMHLNESSGTIADTSGQGNNGTVSGATYSATGKLETALDFEMDNGNNLSVADDDSLDLTTQGTLMAWFKAESTEGISNWNGLMHKGSDTGFSDEAYFLQFDTNRHLVGGGYNGSGNVYVTGTSQVEAGTWYHAAFVWDSSGMSLYLNGSLDQSSSSILANQVSSGSLQIGAQFTSGSDYFFDGIVDEVAIWNRPLSATEIEDIYLRGANRLLFQVRSCDDVSCSGESFVGPDGTSGTYYSEINNSSLGLPSFTLSGHEDKQYFQYRSMFETDDSSYSPEIESVSVEYSASGSSGDTTASACLDLSTDLYYYLHTIPQDPKDGSTGKTYYAIKQADSQGGITVISCSAESGENIRKSR